MTVGEAGVHRPVHLVAAIPEGGLVIVAGLPGAGKSTLLGNIEDGAAVTVLDSDQMRVAFAALFARRVPYRWYRPLVHLAHRARILLYAVKRTRTVVAHEPATRASTRVLLVAIGVLTGRRRHLLWIRSTPEQAWRGQLDRGRVISSRSFARHVRRAHKVQDILADGGRLRGWHSVDIVPRPAPGSKLVVRGRS
jgi:predicted kinase